MEQQQENSLFGLSIDSVTAGYLKETASWAKLLAIVGMISCGLIVIGGIVAAMAVSSATSEFSREMGGSGASAAAGAAMMIFYIIMAVIYFFPCLYTLRFSNHIKVALSSNDQMALNEGMRNLKATFRFMGVITIIFLSLFLLLFLLGGLGAVMG